MLMSKHSFLLSMALLGAVFSPSLIARMPRTKAHRPIACNTVTISPHIQLENDILLDAFLPVLKLNERLKLHFYRCPKRKVTVGYGSNVEKNPDLLTGVTIFHSGKPLNPNQKRLFLSSFATKTDRELQQYRISVKDANRLMNVFARRAITSIAQHFTDPKTNQSFFYDMPLCMQALCLDIFYDVGEDGFKEYKKFRAALKAKNYELALKESVVYTDKKTRHTHKEREYRKKRMMAVMRIAQKYADKPIGDIARYIQQDNTLHRLPNYSRSALEQQLSIEKNLAIAEKAHIILMKKRRLKVLSRTAMPTISDRLSRQKG